MKVEVHPEPKKDVPSMKPLKVEGKVKSSSAEERQKETVQQF